VSTRWLWQENKIKNKISGHSFYTLKHRGQGHYQNQAVKTNLKTKKIEVTLFTCKERGQGRYQNRAALDCRLM